MKKHRAVLACLMLLPAVAFAQQPGPNVNVLPAYPNGNPSPPFPPPPISLTDALRGDGYLQRQVEPAVAASTYNPDHLLAAFGDYRTVSIPNDTGLPEGGTVTGWIGLSRSYDRGHTWFGSMVPCFPQDTSTVCSNSPLFGLKAGSDPTLATTPGGHFYLGALFYTSGGISNVAMVHYRDLPNIDGGDTIRYQGAVIVDRGSMSASGNFIDKPAIAADIARGTTSASVCGPVYIAYTIFNGGDSSTPFTSKVGFARSEQGNCGSVWDKPQYLHKNYKQNQGTAVAVDPNNGKIYVVWRHVFEPGGDGFPDSILMVTSTDGGNTFSNPMPITPATFLPLDQPSLTTINFPQNPTFRSNSFPVIAVDGKGNVYVADQEKTFPTGGTYPSGYYEPRIVIRTLANGRSTWTAGSIVDSGSPSAYAQQFMPALNFAGGVLQLMWYDFREQSQQSDNIVGGWFVTGFDRQMKTYLARSDLSQHDTNGNPAFGPSIAVTQYLINADTGKIPTVGNVQSGYPAVNRPNLPIYSGGTTAFTGDYLGIVAASPFVRNLQPGATTAFRWASQAADFIALPSFGVWTDARDVVFPTTPMGGGTKPIIDDITGWQTYAPPGTGALSCVNPGARNANVYLSEIKPGVIAGSPSTSRQLVDGTGHPMERAFPIYVQNPNAGPGLFFRVSFQSLGSTSVAGSFTQGTELTSPQTSVDLEILQYSSSTVTLYVFCPSCSSSRPLAPFAANVQQITALGGMPLTPGGLQTAVFFDSDPTAPFVTNANLGTTETHNAMVSNPQFGNPQFGNPQFGNPQFGNPQFGNPQFGNPQFGNIAPVSSLPVGDFVYQVTDAGNTASAYTALANIAQSNLTNSYVYELIISRSYNFPGFDAACNSQAIPTDAIISIIPNPQFGNPQFGNPQFGNPQFGNPQFGNTQFSNATFAAVPPPPGSTSTASALLSTTSTSTSTSSDDGTTKMPLGTDHVYFVLRVYRTGDDSTVLSPTEQSAIIANTSVLVFPQAPTTTTGPPVVQPPAPANSNKTLTSTVLTSSLNPSTFGQSVTFTATVSPNPGPGATGTVNFRDGSILLKTVPLSSGTATLPISSLTAGVHTITAVYSGDANFDGSLSNSVTQTVSQASTTTILVSNPNPSVFGQPVTLIATVSVVSPGAGIPTGAVNFFDGGNNIGSVPLGGDPLAILTVSSLSAGPHTLTATYGGDNNFAGSPSNAVAQTVTQANTTTSLTSSVNPSVSGQSVTFTATVLPVSPGAGTPSGTINFVDGGVTKLGACCGGFATFTTSALSVGTHTITAVYLGVPNFLGSISNAISEQVNAVVTNTNDSGQGSLRQAILDVNAQSGPPLTIVFNIPVSGVQSIAPLTALPTVMQPAILDATTQPGWAGPPIIELNGSSAGAGVNGLHISAGNSTVRGFVINRFSGNGILLDTNGRDFIQGNYIGTDSTGTVAQPNGGNGIQIVAIPNNVVGGTLRNVISGNRGEGVRIDGTLATRNAVEGNYIGTDATGSVAVGNSASGIYLRNAPVNSVTGNVVSGNLGFAGITICGNDPGGCGGGDVPGIDETSIASSNLIEGNRVGTDASGVNSLGNNQAGVSIDGAPDTFLGTTAGAGNIISFNGTNDVQIFSPAASRTKIFGNTIQGKPNATTVGISEGIFGSLPAGTGNTFNQNSILGHGGLGIDLAPLGVNLNTSGGAHNFPVITSAQLANGTTTIAGTLNSTANATFTIEFFSNLSCNPSGYGEGAIFLGSTSVVTDGNGNASFSFSASVGGVALGNAITTTSTDAGGTTSEFSACATVAANAVSLFDDFNTATVTQSPSGPPTPTTFTLTATLTQITQLETYQWNNGLGVTPGSISLQDQSGKIYGPFGAQGFNSQSQQAPPFVAWIAMPSNLTLPPGTFTVISSDPTTWSYNITSNNEGFVRAAGVVITP